MYASAIIALAAALAPSALAAPPTSQLTARTVTFNCANAYTDCVNTPYADAEHCSDVQTSCLACNSAEEQCRDGADYSAQIQCTVNAQRCYFEAENPSTLGGQYGCDASFATCKSAPMENNAYCASEDSGCRSCEDQENECRTAPEANQSFCSSQVAECFHNVTSLN